MIFCNGIYNVNVQINLKNQILLFLLCLLVLNGYAVAEAETESLPRIRAAPERNTEGSVIDGTGTEDVLDLMVLRMDWVKGRLEAAGSQFHQLHC